MDGMDIPPITLVTVYKLADDEVPGETRRFALIKRETSYLCTVPTPQPTISCCISV